MVRTEQIEQSILLIRGHKVMLDVALAELYGVQAKVLNQAVKRNKDRFPSDFMFQLTDEEFYSLRYFKVTNCDLRNRSWTTSEISSLCVY